MAKIVFFCHVNRAMIETTEFYRQDIVSLRNLGHEVIVCTRYSQIPFDFDAIFVWWWTYALWPVLLCKLLRKPCIITGTYNFRFPRNFDGRDYFRRPWWQKRIIRYVTTSATLNLFVNRNELESCSKYFGLKNGRYFPHILHEDYLNGPREERRDALLNIAWSGKKNLIRKGIPEILKAVRMLKDDGIAISLIMAGHKGDGFEDLIKMVNQLGIDDNVHYLGEVTREEKIDLLRTCEIYVQPSHYEGFGVAIAEAMGCGACVITCDVGAVREVVGNSGIYVSPDAPEELAKAIGRVLYDKKLRHEYQESAYQRACSYFGEDKKLQRLETYLSEIGIS